MPQDIPQKMRELKTLISTWALEAGFQQVGITDCDLTPYEDHLKQWIQADYHGEMDYMQRNIALRLDPGQLVDGTLRVLSFRMDYLPKDQKERMPDILASDTTAYISRYALGRDYHKLMRKRLAGIAKKIADFAETALNQRAFVDSAPVLERAFAEKAGLGWIGRNTMLINSKAGSYFFLGEIMTSLPLPIDSSSDTLHCGSCTACLTACPTDAFVGSHRLDAKKCISYLTIEHKGSIPLTLRSKIGNRVYGCDDCQMVCPWNKFSHPTVEDDFSPRNHLDSEALVTLFQWSEEEFLTKTAGSPIRRIGYQQWIRNLAVGLGNAPGSPEISQALLKKAKDPSIGEIAKEHIHWAIQQADPESLTMEPTR